MTPRIHQITPTESRVRPALPLPRPTAPVAARGRVAVGEIFGETIARRSATPLDRLVWLVGMLRVWMRRARERRELADLDDDQMRDAGISREAARREAEKPFWRA
ncbi:DUF1127 domain-containing protein [Roseixanthobacter glucoisosaccharinicivorans]|uniref:DUF1127 domain-containing protein n=1 Tax=Roseixanthobacter glucoisosaccharinicivorans TaxID=3119923 RepID=UPI00372B7CDF